MGCGDCTACCDIFEITELNKPKHLLCEHHTGVGCGIYKERPAACREFVCGYLAASTSKKKSDKWAEELRPDKSGVVIREGKDGYEALKIRDEISPAMDKHMRHLVKTYNINIKLVDARKKEAA